MTTTVTLVADSDPLTLATLPIPEVEPGFFAGIYLGAPAQTLSAPLTVPTPRPARSHIATQEARHVR